MSSGEMGVLFGVNVKPPTSLGIVLSKKIRANKRVRCVMATAWVGAIPSERDRA